MKSLKEKITKIMDWEWANGKAYTEYEPRLNQILQAFSDELERIEEESKEYFIDGPILKPIKAVSLSVIQKARKELE